jgi:tRNA threonylcarbamoyladenosine biosynthesis protein TsaE
VSGPLLGPGRPVYPSGRVPGVFATGDQGPAGRAGAAGGSIAVDGPIRLPTAEDTYALGVRLAALLRGGDLIVLSGPLGAGKTVLVQGIGAGLEVGGPIVSPTFVIARVHRGPLPLVHVDAYRLSSLAEVDDLDLDVDAADAVTVVEWGAGLVEQLAESRLEVVLAREADTEVRTARLFFHGGGWQQRIAGLA